MTRPFQCTLLNTTYNTLIGGSYFFQYYTSMTYPEPFILILLNKPLEVYSIIIYFFKVTLPMG